MKVPLRGRGGKQDRPEESKKGFFTLLICHTHFPAVCGSEVTHPHARTHSDHRDQLSLVIKHNEQGVLLMSSK